MYISPYNEEALVVTATDSTGKGELADKTDYLHTERKEAKGFTFFANTFVHCAHTMACLNHTY